MIVYEKSKQISEFSYKRGFNGYTRVICYAVSECNVTNKCGNICCYLWLRTKFQKWSGNVVQQFYSDLIPKRAQTRLSEHLVIRMTKSVVNFRLILILVLSTSCDDYEMVKVYSSNNLRK